jgi:hypothetical protein
VSCQVLVQKLFEFDPGAAGRDGPPQGMVLEAQPDQLPCAQLKVKFDKFIAVACITL